MSAALDLFAGQGARTADPDTSWQAAFRNLTGKRADRGKVLLAHAVRNGLTDFELAAILARQQTSVGKRRGELRDMGLIEATEFRRSAPSGSPAIVWRVTDLGRAVAAALRSEQRT